LHLSFSELSPSEYRARTAKMREQEDVYKGLWECAGGIIGASRNTPFLTRVLLPWAACSFYRACVSPNGTHRGNDRQDQTALNLILYYRRWKSEPYPGVLMHIGDNTSVALLPEPDLDLYSLEAPGGKGVVLKSANPRIIPANMSVVLYSRKRFPPYLYQALVVDADAN